MTEGVLVTPRAKEAAERISRILSGPLTEQINQLRREAEVLRDKNVFRGATANAFDTYAQEADASLSKTVQSLEEFRQKTQQIMEMILQY